MLTFIKIPNIILKHIEQTDFINAQYDATT